jgi:hypothetical protein
MAFSKQGAALLLAGGAFLALAACGGNGAVPSGSPVGGNAASQLFRGASSDASPDDTTSILKKLRKDVVIGTTVDPKNGDMGPHGVAIARSTYGLKKGQLAVCNFSNSSGAAGKGTTIELLDPKPGSKPTSFVQSSKIQGCSGDAVSNNNSVYATGLTSGLLAGFDNTGKLIKTYGSPFEAPFSDADASNANLYAAEYIFGSDATTGSIVSFSINYYGNRKETQVATGFGVNKKSGWTALGPSGVQYWPGCRHCKIQDTLYIADGVDSTIVSFNNASELLLKNEIVVKPGGKTFKCLHPQTTCGKLVHSGKPLDAPVAMAILPNGNLIAANTGSNELVELTPSGKILDTKVVDKSKTAGIFGLVASGKNDSDTVLYYTDANDNNLHELEQ